jgi:cytochrome c553
MPPVSLAAMSPVRGWSLLLVVLLATAGCGGRSAAPRDVASEEVEEALRLEPDIQNGLRIYHACAQCHQPEGWGLPDGSVPQLAGQHRKVIIKQLADIRSGHRSNPDMLPFASVAAIGGPQAVADVAGYVDTLEISLDNGKGAGDDLEHGARLYSEHCARCHGPEGEGDGDRYVPRLQSQHYVYLLRQFEGIQHGRRANANPEMVTEIHGFSIRDRRAVLDWVSRQRPPEGFEAPPGWRNPDFPD